MTTPRRFEQDLPALLGDLYVTGIPDYRDDLFQETARTRQRPAWSFPGRWFPMDIVTQRVSTPRTPWRAIAALALIAVLIAAAVAVYVGSRPRLPAPFGVAANGRIVYSDAGDIMARDSVTGTPRVLIAGDQTDEHPLFSPLGDRFIFLRKADETSAQLMLANADGGDARALTDPMTPPDTWDWSPDGAAVVIGRDGRPDLTVIPTDGSAPVTLATPPRSDLAYFRPPFGAQILIRGTDGSGNPGLYLVHRDGSGVVRLDLQGSGNQGHDFSHGYAWSEDGTRLAYVVVEQHPASGVDSGLRIHVAKIDADGRVLSDEALEFDPAADNELNPVFVPGRNELVLQSREGNEDYLSIASLDPVGPPTRLDGISSTSDGGIGYAIDPDGRGLVALLWNEQTAWRYDFDTMEASPAQLGSSDVATWQRLAPE